MNKQEQEQLLNDVAMKVGVLKLNIRQGRIKETDDIKELLETYDSYVEEGTTITELKLIHEDLMLHLSEV